jgi:cysteine desulfurase
MNGAKRAYFDHAAAAPVDNRVLEAMLPYFRERFGNPQSIYAEGAEAKEALDRSRDQVAQLVNAHPEEITFTATGSEGNNLALKGIAFGRQDKGRHIMVSAIEHVSVLNPAKSLARNGFEATQLAVDSRGMVDPGAVKAGIRKDTILVSVMAANSEVGTIQPVAEIGRICREAGVVFHTDAVAAAGSIPIDVQAMNVDALTLAGPTFCGPRGAAALYVRKGVRLPAQIEGGSQENNRRAGSEDVPAIVGLGKAAELARTEMAARSAALAVLRDRLIRELPARIERVYLTGDSGRRLPGHASFCIEFIEGEAMLLFLEDAGIAVASGSACTSKSLKASHVLLAMGLPHSLAQGSLMLTLGPENTDDDVSRLLAALPGIVQRLRAMSPLYAQFRKDPAGYEARLTGERECIVKK